MGFKQLVLIIGILWCSAASAQMDIQYGIKPYQKLDLFHSQNVNPQPVVLFFHGGGFTTGSKNDLPSILRDELLERGFAVASVGYGLGPVDGKYPGPYLDGARALQFLRLNAATYNLDKTDVILIGGSAGGGIAQWVGFREDLAIANATDPILRESTRVDGVGIINGQTTYTPSNYVSLFGAKIFPDFIAQFFGVPVSELSNPARQMEFFVGSPIAHYSLGDPPLYYLYTHEGTVNPNDYLSYIHNWGMTRIVLDRNYGIVTVRRTIYSTTQLANGDSVAIADWNKRLEDLAKFSLEVIELD